MVNGKWKLNGINGAILYISMTGNLLHINYSLFVFPLDKLGVNGAILYISMTGNLLHINYSLFVFPLDKLDYR